jgi:hypothetical protein
MSTYFLEEQLGCVRDKDLRDFRLVVAQSTFELGRSQIGNTLHATAKEKVKASETASVRI